MSITPNAHHIFYPSQRIQIVHATLLYPPHTPYPSLSLFTPPKAHHILTPPNRHVCYVSTAERTNGKHTTVMLRKRLVHNINASSCVALHYIAVHLIVELQCECITARSPHNRMQSSVRRDWSSISAFVFVLDDKSAPDCVCEIAWKG